MKISRLIEHLQRIQVDRGDIEVCLAEGLETANSCNNYFPQFNIDEECLMEVEIDGEAVDVDCVHLYLFAKDCY